MTPTRRAGATDAAAQRVVDEREQRLKAARDRVLHYQRDDVLMSPGLTVSLAADATQTELADARATAAAIVDAAAALGAARAARLEGAPLRALGLAERAHELAPTADTLRTLGAVHRDLGNLSEAVALHRQGVKELPAVRDNAPGWLALGASLLAAGQPAEAEQIALELVNHDDEEPHGWRLLARVSAGSGDVPRAAEAFEHSARLGLDPSGALSGLQALRNDTLARGDRATAVDLEDRIARLRSR